MGMDQETKKKQTTNHMAFTHYLISFHRDKEAHFVAPEPARIHVADVKIILLLRLASNNASVVLTHVRCTRVTRVCVGSDNMRDTR